MKIKPVTVGRGVIYLIAFLFALHQTPFAYINSTFLAQFVGEGNVGLIYTLGSILTIGGFLMIRPLLKRFGNYHTFGIVLLIDFITLIVLSFSVSGVVAIIAYVIGYTMRNLAMFHLDIFLEDVSTEKDAGGVRGIYLSIMSVSFVIGPLLSGFLLTDTDFWKVYLLGAGILLPTFFILLRYLKYFKDPVYKEPTLLITAKKVMKNVDMYSIFSINSLLRFFYSWMVIYAPIYMVQHIGFTISETTFIIAIALVAFVILEAPLGYLADNYFGEKEFLVIGFLILAGSTATIAFLPDPNFTLWAIVLFITRTGASFVEVGSEAYFFKKVDISDINVLGFFRMLRPFVYMISPLLASLLLLIVDIRFLFLILGAVMLYGIRYSLALKDTL